ncbi:MAG: cell division protein SepF [Bacillota bacterium]
MAKIMDKVLGFMGFEEEEVEIMEDEIMDTEDTQQQAKSKKKGTLFNLHSQKNTRVVVCEPKSFDECKAIADNLKSHRAVIINLEDSDMELAKRVVDFISGTTYALNGSMQKVGNGIFLFVPNNMEIAGEAKDTLKDKDKGIFTWVR